MSFSTQSLTTTDTNTVITFTGCDSATFTSTANVGANVDLWISGTASTDIVATGVLIDLASGISGYAVGHTGAMVVQGDNATAAELLNERLYKSDGTFIGVCTAVGGTTSITVAGGIEVSVADEENLYVGNRYYIVKNRFIPNSDPLKLNGNEINFPTSNYILLGTTSTSSVDIVFRESFI